jgi:eukaryotic-like serine/threonine-protein kinase
MPLSIGDKLGPYDILEAIGAGGMGEVWRALDTRLDRVVAIKVSQERFSDRFEREARAVAALNHPDICTLYDVGPNFLVLELIDGESPKGPLPLEEALRIARQIADALDAAHEKGIVHRDLKPANIKIKPDGTVKVLDFGLAKTFELTSGDPETSPTMTVSPTRAGMIMGTAAYMSPEQARGKTVDKRTDIWAFGVVLYELLTGGRPFHGEDLTDTLASVMKDKPDLSRVPIQVRRLIERCLEKDPKKRLRDIADAWIAIDAAFAGDSPSIYGGYRGRWAGWCVAAVALVGLAAISLLHSREKRPVPTAPLRFQIPPEESVGSITLSPDGRKLAIVRGGRLWVHSLESGESRDLTATEGGVPFWSSDSRSIGYTTEGKVKRIEAVGGPPQTVAVGGLGFLWAGADWNRDDVIVFGDRRVGLFRVPATGGVPVQITALDPARREFQHFRPSFLPDGRHFVYMRASVDAGKSAFYLGSVDARPEEQSSKPLVTSNSGPAYAPSDDPSAGYLLFVREGTLMAQPFDSRRLELKGRAAPVAEEIEGGYGAFSASANGTLGFRQGAASQLTWYDRQGKVSGTAAELGVSENLALSPDGTRLAVTKGGGTGATNIWLVDLSRGGAGTRFTFDSANDASPVWSPDGSRIIFSSNRDGPLNLYQKPANGVKDEGVLLRSSENKLATSWSRDGRFLLYEAVHPKTKNDLWVLPLEGDRQPVPFLITEFNERQARFSPDCHWVAYTSDESGQDEVYVRSFSVNSAGTAVQAGGKYSISGGFGVDPHWRGDGRELYYRSRSGGLMAVEIATSPAFRAGSPQPLGVLTSAFVNSVGSSTWDSAADGRRFLKVAATGGSRPYQVVLNWQASLKK